MTSRSNLRLNPITGTQASIKYWFHMNDKCYRIVHVYSSWKKNDEWIVYGGAYRDQLCLPKNKIYQRVLAAFQAELESQKSARE